MSLLRSGSTHLRLATLLVSSAALLLSACVATVPPAQEPISAPATTLPIAVPTTTPAVQPGPIASNACRPIGVSGAQADLSPTASLTPQQAVAEASTAFVYALIDPTVLGGPGSVPVVVTSLDSQGRPQIQEITAASLEEARSEVAAIASDSIAQGLQVVSVEPDSLVHAVASPTTNDPWRPSQWALNQFNFESLWSNSNGSGVCVAVVDSGIAVSHIDLAGKVAASADWSGEGVTSYGDHATHVAGIIAATPNNGLGTVGAAPGVTLLNAKALTAVAGTGTTTGVAQAITWAVDNGAEVINISIGGSAGSSALLSAVNYAQSNDVVLVASGGNEGLTGSSPSWPAAYDWPIATASITDTGALSAFSTRASYIDVAAPGSSILSTITLNRFAYMSGTSMAAPHVTALAALARAAHPTESAAQIRSRIMASSTDAGSVGWDSSFGWGVINPSAAG